MKTIIPFFMMIVAGMLVAGCNKNSAESDATNNPAGAYAPGDTNSYSATNNSPAYANTNRDTNAPATVTNNPPQ